MESELSSITPAHEQHGHPSACEVDGEYWEHWHEWAESAEESQLQHRTAQLQMLVRPKLDFYYEMDPAKLVTISE